jgi:hypothetical protein
MPALHNIVDEHHRQKFKLEGSYSKRGTKLFVVIGQYGDPIDEILELLYSGDWGYVVIPQSTQGEFSRDSVLE